MFKDIRLARKCVSKYSFLITGIAFVLYLWLQWETVNDVSVNKMNTDNRHGDNGSMRKHQRSYKYQKDSNSNMTFMLNMLNKLPSASGLKPLVWMFDVMRKLTHKLQPNGIENHYLCGTTRVWKTALSKNIESGLFTSEQQQQIQIVLSGWQRRYPEAIIIGCKKCSTTALENILSIAHPRISMKNHEGHFFSNEENYKKGLDYYLSQMPYSFPDQITIEKTPTYWISKDTPKRVHKMNPKIKLILLVRDPVVRVISEYRHMEKKRFYLPRRTLDSYITDGSGQIQPGSPIIQHSYYDNNIIRWLEFFPLSQILVVDQLDILNLKFETLAEIEKFLGIPHEMYETLYLDKDSSVCAELHRLVGEKCIERVISRHSKPKEEVVQQLKQLLKPHAEKFYEIINRKFNWTFT